MVDLWRGYQVVSPGHHRSGGMLGSMLYSAEWRVRSFRGSPKSTNEQEMFLPRGRYVDPFTDSNHDRSIPAVVVVSRA